MTALEVDFSDGPESFETARPLPRKEVTTNAGTVPGAERRAGRTDVGGQRAVQAIAGRSLPASVDAERSLLGSIFVDPEDVLARCDEARVTADDLTDPQCGAIYGAMRDLRQRGHAIDQATVAEAIKAHPAFAGRNIYSVLSDIATSTSTTAQAPFFIERVRDTAVLRAVIVASTRAVERAFNGGDPAELLSDHQAELRAIAETGESAGAASIMARAFNPAQLIPRPDPIYAIAGTTICTRGNLTTIYSQAKTGKSSFIAAMMAATMTTPTSAVDTLGVQGPNYGKGAVLHFDTEQSPYDWQQLVRSSLRRAGLAEPPPWLMSFTIAGMEAQRAERFIHQAVRLARKLHGSIHSIFIDGVADLVNDPNSPDECFPLVARLHGLAIEYDTTIVCILHLNPTAKDKADKGRGHLGSQLERKCESNLTLKKDGDTTTVCGEGRQRGSPIPPDRSPAFRWSDEHRMHRSCALPKGDIGNQRSTGGRPQTYEYSTYADLMPKKCDHGLPLSQLAKRLSVNKPITSKQLYNVLARWEEEGLVEIVSGPAGRLYRQAV